MISQKNMSNINSLVLEIYIYNVYTCTFYFRKGNTLETFSHFYIFKILPSLLPQASKLAVIKGAFNVNNITLLLPFKLSCR